jgi:hypothetical protein
MRYFPQTGDRKKNERNIDWCEYNPDDSYLARRRINIMSRFGYQDLTVVSATAQRFDQ